jgi:hypothetical protein
MVVEDKVVKILAKVSIPGRLRDGMLLKNAEYFEVPHSNDGIEFMRWWEEAGSGDRDTLMKQAYDSNTGIVEALKARLEGGCE